MFLLFKSKVIVGDCEGGSRGLILHFNLDHTKTNWARKVRNLDMGDGDGVQGDM